jgi:5-formyltetrahydrofolate cyclo-ligase
VEAPLDAAKRHLRRRLAALRRAVTPEAAQQAGLAVARELLGCELFRSAQRVALYAALPDELPTRPCFEALRARGALALLPRCADAAGLVFHALERWEDLRAGRYGVPEPPAGAPAVEARAADLVLVPGVAFDARGQRLGRGGGFYDATFPPGAAAPPLFGVGYEFQVVEAVPHGSRDRRMDAIVTERGIRWVTEGR